MGLGFIVGIVSGFVFISLIIFWIDYKENKEFEKTKELFKGVTFDDFEIYDEEDVTNVRMDDGTEYGRKYNRLNRTGAYTDHEGFMHIDDYELAIGKIVSLKDYQIAKAKVKLADDNTYEFERVIMDAYGNIEQISSSNIKKKEIIKVFPDSFGNLRLTKGCSSDLR